MSADALAPDALGWLYPDDTLGDRIRQARRLRGMSQTDLASRLTRIRLPRLDGATRVPIDPTTVSAWERGRRNPTRRSLRLLARALDVDVAWLEGIA